MAETAPGTLTARVEVTKLARELGVDDDVFAFLTALPTAELRELRTRISAAMLARHESRFARVAALSNLLPPVLTAKIARLGMGALLSARVASVMEADDAIRLARHLDPDFMAELAPMLDPTRVAVIIDGLPGDLVVDVGRRLLDGEHITLGRFVSVVSVETAMLVVAEASGADLLEIALHSEDMTVLDEVITRVDDEVLQEVLLAAVEAGRHADAIAVLTTLAPASRTKLVRQLAVLDAEAIAGFIAALDDHDGWPHLLPTLTGLDDEVLRNLLGSPAARDVAVLDTVVRTAHRLDVAGVVPRLVAIIDEAHLASLRATTALAVPAIRQWVVESSGLAPAEAERLLTGSSA